MSKRTFVAAADTAVPAQKGFFGRLLSGVMAARQRQADREVERYLARHSDRMLRDIGMTEDEIDNLRKRYGS